MAKQQKVTRRWTSIGFGPLQNINYIIATKEPNESVVVLLKNN